MSSIWSSATQSGSNPFATTGMAPVPGGSSAAMFQPTSKSTGLSAGPSTPITNGHVAQTSVLNGAKNADSAVSSSASTDSSATITANDFLTLLVTEMQHQDPTAQTDPNEYINQLVQINSLEQLISINQNLSKTPGTASTSASSANSSGNPLSGISGTPKLTSPTKDTGSAHVATPRSGSNSASTSKSRSVSGAGTGLGGGVGRTVAGGLPTSTSHAFTSGNIGLPEPSAASARVSRSLNGQHAKTTTGHAIRDVPIR